MSNIRKHVVSVVGNRPQYIKSALLHTELSKRCKLTIINTGQHYDYEMSDIFFDELKCPKPMFDLRVGSGSHAEQTANTMLRLESHLKQLKPDVVLVYGDTNSTLAGALTAAKLKIPVAHVEAGPRQDDIKIPEEINRVVTDHVSTYCFTPTHACYLNLFKEHLDNIAYNTGDIMLDNFLHFAPNMAHYLKLRRTRKHILVTIHRPINTDNKTRLKQIIDSLCKLEDVIFPMHPRTRKAIKEKIPFQVSEPVGYLKMLELLLGAKVVITDSGGLQKEAYFAGVPCLTLDINSPWPETLGCNKVIKPDEIVESTQHITEYFGHQDITRDVSQFGDGKAHEKIVEVLLR